MTKLKNLNIKTHKHTDRFNNEAKKEEEDVYAWGGTYLKLFIDKACGDSA